uniref:Prohibitin n=1 Tax=Steinernema glaseri TaxID=37863 RepID=A0A1I8AFH0_9BILA
MPLWHVNNIVSPVIWVNISREARTRRIDFFILFGAYCPLFKNIAKNFVTVESETLEQPPDFLRKHQTRFKTRLCSQTSTIGSRTLQFQRFFTRRNMVKESRDEEKKVVASIQLIRAFTILYKKAKEGQEFLEAVSEALAAFVLADKVANTLQDNAAVIALVLRKNLSPRENLS